MIWRKRIVLILKKHFGESLMMILVHQKDFIDVDVRWSREDLPVDMIDAPSIAQHSQDEAMETSEEEDDFNYTYWDWMEVDD